jgi:hypothetical protein
MPSKMYDDNFYIQVSSDSSLKTFPDNRMCAFHVRFPRRLRFHHKTKVALAAITMTNSLYPFNSAKQFWINAKDEKYPATPLYVEPKNYRTLTDLVDEMNDIISTKIQAVASDRPPHISVKKEGTNSIVSLKNGVLNGVEVEIDVASKTLRNILGLDRQGIGYINAAKNQLFIYSDLVSPRVVGHVTAPLLRTVNSIPRHSVEDFDQIFYRFPNSKRQYISLAQTEVGEAEFYVADDTGEEPLGSGKLVLTLHFKK